MAAGKFVPFEKSKKDTKEPKGVKAGDKKPVKGAFPFPPKKASK